MLMREREIRRRALPVTDHHVLTHRSSSLYAYIDMETLGELIRRRRQELDLSLRDLAARLKKGATPPYLSDIELGRRYPSDELLARLAVALETPLDVLKAADTRPPVDDLRRLSEKDAQLGFALRKAVEQGLTGEQLLDFLKAKRKP